MNKTAAFCPNCKYCVNMICIRTPRLVEVDKWQGCSFFILRDNNIVSQISIFDLLEIK